MQMVANGPQYQGISLEDVEKLKPYREYILTEKGFELLSELTIPPQNTFETLEVLKRSEDEVLFEISSYDNFIEGRPKKVDGYLYSL